MPFGFDAAELMVSLTLPMAFMNQAKIATLYQAHGHALFHVCLRLVGVSSSARELVQATFCEFAKKRVRLISKGSRFAFLCRLAKALARPMPETSRPGVDQDIKLARYLADDLARSERIDLEETLAATQSLQVRLAVMRSDRAAFYAFDPPAQFAHRVSTVLASRGPAPIGVARVAIITLAMAGIVAIGVAVMRSWQPKSEPPAFVEVPEKKTPLPPASAPTSQPTSTPVEPASIRVEEPAKPSVEPSAKPMVPPPPPLVVKTPASQPVPSAPPTSGDKEGVRMMATFDFGETLGRVSLFEGRSKQKSVPAGASLQVRANIPEPGYAAVFSFDPETQTLAALAGPTKVEPGWRILARFAVDKNQRVYMVFTVEPTPLAKLSSSFSRALKEDVQALLPIDRQARIDLTLEH